MGNEMVAFKFDPIDITFSAGGAVAAMMILHFVHVQAQAQGFTAMCPPLGAVAVLVFALPAAPASKPISVAAGFLFGSIAVWGIYTAVGENFLKDFGGTRALLVGGAIAAMKITDTVHPPVGAYSVLMADVPAIKALGPKYILFPGLAGALVLVAVSVVTNQIKAAMTSKVKKA